MAALSEKNEETKEVICLLLKIEGWKKQKRWRFITPKELGELMESIESEQDANTLQIIDVRRSEQDYIGGHIPGSTNIQYPTFKPLLPRILSEYAKKENFVIHCMYSQCRGLRCLREYRDYIEDMIGNRYYQFLKEHQSTEMNVEYQDLKGEQQSFVLNGETATDIMKQSIFVLKGGFNAWITHHYHLKDNGLDLYVADFRDSYWKRTNKNGQIEL